MTDDSNAALTPLATGEPATNEIEVTPAIVEAGLSPIFCYDRNEGDDEEAVKEIYLAMALAKSRT